MTDDPDPCGCPCGPCDRVPCPFLARVDVDRVILAGVCSTREDARELADLTSRFGLNLDDVLASVARGSAQTLDNLGLRVRAPEPPEPPADLVEHFRRLYGPRSERAYSTARAVFGLPGRAERAAEYIRRVQADIASEREARLRGEP